jgi:hypothetical protein
MNLPNLCYLDLSTFFNKAVKTHGTDIGARYLSKSSFKKLKELRLGKSNFKKVIILGESRLLRLLKQTGSWWNGLVWVPMAIIFQN